MTQHEDKVWINTQGHTVPDALVKPQHKLEDDLVRKLISEARTFNDALGKMKLFTFDEVNAFRDLLAEEYDTKRGGSRGGMTFRTYDGSLEVQISVGENIAFGPELEVAKELIDACILRWSEDANDNIKVLVQDAFQTNKQGRINTGRVLGLRSLKIEDDEWKKAMDAIGDAVRKTTSKTYARFYEIDTETGARTAIPLDIAAV